MEKWPVNAHNGGRLSWRPARLLATQPKDFAYQVCFTKVFFIKRSFFRLTANSWPMDFLVICIPFVCLGQEDDGA